MPVKHLERGAFLCYFINLSVKLPKLEFARTSLDGINTYFHSFSIRQRAKPAKIPSRHLKI